MSKEFVIVKGKKIEVTKNWLDLKNKDIEDISEISGLEKLTNLFHLNLRENRITEIKGLEKLINIGDLNLRENGITEIKGLETLTNLLRLDLSGNQITEIKCLENNTKLYDLNLHGNQITEIKGLDMLKNLTHLWLSNNPLNELKGLETLNKLKYLWIKKTQIRRIIVQEECGDLNIDGSAKNAQMFVKYCREKQRRIIQKIIRVSKNIKLEWMRKVLNLDQISFDNRIFDWATEFNFKIENDKIIINQSTLDDFIDALNSQFEAWDEKEKGKIDKIY